MRIAIVTWSRRQTGGAERYLANVAPALASAGHAVALWTESDVPSNRPLIAPADRFPTFTASELGVAKSLDTLKAWSPDLLYCHGLLSPSHESRVLDVA